MKIQTETTKQLKKQNNTLLKTIRAFEYEKDYLHFFITNRNANFNHISSKENFNSAFFDDKNLKHENCFTRIGSMNHGVKFCFWFKNVLNSVQP